MVNFRDGLEVIEADSEAGEDVEADSEVGEDVEAVHEAVEDVEGVGDTRADSKQGDAHYNWINASNASDPSRKLHHEVEPLGAPTGLIQLLHLRTPRAFRAWAALKETAGDALPQTLQ